MNILHLTHTDINSDSRILKEMHTLAKSNPDYRIYGIGIYDSNNRSTKDISGLNITSLNLLSRKLTFVPSILRHILLLIEMSIRIAYLAIILRPKVIHCHDVIVLPIGAFVKLFTPSKLIYDAHELESHRNGISELLGKFVLIIEKLSWWAVDALIVVSPSISNWYNTHLKNRTTEIILNSPVLEKNGPQNEEKYLRGHFSIPEDSKVFLYVGMLIKGRGLDLITDAFRKHDLKSSLVLMGYGAMTEELKILASAHSNIYVHAAVAHERVVSVAKSADVGLCFIQKVSLSDYFCLPNKLFEYSFAGIPVLASDFPDITVAVEKYGLGKCASLTTESVYNAIKEFEELEKLPEIKIEDLYDLSWGAQAEKLIKLYENLKVV